VLELSDLHNALHNPRHTLSRCDFSRVPVQRPVEHLKLRASRAAVACLNVCVCVCVCVCGGGGGMGCWRQCIRNRRQGSDGSGCCRSSNGCGGGDNEWAEFSRWSKPCAGPHHRTTLDCHRHAPALPPHTTAPPLTVTDTHLHSHRGHPHFFVVVWYARCHRHPMHATTVDFGKVIQEQLSATISVRALLRTTV
jgi:hypothetical protein